LVAYETHLVVGGEGVVKSKKCFACGAIIRSDREICRKCGAKQPEPAVTTRPVNTNNSTAALKKPSDLRWLPGVFYNIAIFGFIGWIIIAFNLKSWEAGAYGFGSMIACLASGRLIELLQEINDELYTRRMSESP